MTFWPWEQFGSDVESGGLALLRPAHCQSWATGWWKQNLTDLPALTGWTVTSCNSCCPLTLKHAESQNISHFSGKWLAKLHQTHYNTLLEFWLKTGGIASRNPPDDRRGRICLRGSQLRNRKNFVKNSEKGVDNYDGTGYIRPTDRTIVFTIIQAGKISLSRFVTHFHKKRVAPGGTAPPGGGAFFAVRKSRAPPNTGTVIQSRCFPRPVHRPNPGGRQ